MNKSGFSLIEIMIVIMIIGVLAAGTFGGLRWLQRAKLTTTETKLAAMDTMIEQYSTTMGEYPLDLQATSMDGDLGHPAVHHSRCTCGAVGGRVPLVAAA